MVLLHGIIQVLDWPDDDRRFASAINIIHGSFIGSALVHRDLLGSTASLHGFLEEPQGCGLVAPGRQQEVDRLSLLVHRAVQVFLDTLDLDVSLVHAPAAAHRELVLAEHLLKQGQKPDRPAIDRGMVDEHAAFLHHFLQVAMAQRIRCIPANAHQNDIDWKAHSFGRQHLVQTFSVKALSIDEQAALPPMRQNPKSNSP